MRAIDFVRVPSLGAAERRTLAQTPRTTAAPDLYEEALEYVTRTFAELRAGRRINLSEAFSIAMRVTTNLGSGNSLLKRAMDRTTPFSSPLHSVNVSIIAARIAQTLHWPEHRIQQVALAGLVHEVGEVRVPTSLIFKSASPSEQERMEMKQRPLQSAELVSGRPGFEWLRRMVLEVNERENGTGFPMGLRNREICDEAKVLGVADVFEACLHQRAHRAAITGHEAIRIIASDEQGFPEQIRKAVIQSFSVYPYNEYVRLNTGEIAVVTDINPANALRPLVRVLYSSTGIQLSEPKTIDLTKHSQVHIHAALTAAELPQFA